jgi:hypothetical protein
MNTDFAPRLIAKFGTDMQLVWYTDVVPEDPAQVWKPAGTTAVTQTVKGVRLVANRWKFGLMTDMQITDGVPNTEARVLIAARGLTKAVNLKGELRMFGEAWQIVSAEPLVVNEDIITYMMQVRQ